MKKILFATSALVMTAGFAAAEVGVSGDGRMGMIYDGDDLQFSSRIRAKFTMTGETDSGLAFGGSFRVDHQDELGGKATSGTAGSVFVAGTYGKLSMGDVVSAAEVVHGNLYEVGYTSGTFAGDHEEFDYLTGDGANLDQGPNVLYEYTMGQIGFAASLSDGDDGFDGNGSDKTAYSLAAKYDNGQYFGGLSFADNGFAEELGLSVGMNYNNIAAKLVYLDYSDREIGGGLDLDKTIGADVVYTMDAWTFGGFWRRDDLSGETTIGSKTGSKFDSFGIGTEYALGGGATLAAGIVDSDLNDDTVADMGIKFKF